MALNREVFKADDPRSPLQKLRRGVLKKIVREAGIEINESTTVADELRQIIRSNNLDYSEYLGEMHSLGPKAPMKRRLGDLENQLKEQGKQNAELKEMVEKLMAALSTSQEKASEKDETPESFEGLPIWRLRQLCKANGIESQKTDKAADLVKKLNDHFTDGR